MTASIRSSRTARPVLRIAVAVIAVALVLIRNPITGTAQNSTVTITVDPTANRHPIDPNIYGVAHATTAQLNDLNTPLNRNGGNNTTRYNWQLNADNRGNDWYFESIADSSATAGERGDTFITNARAANAEAMLTIPRSSGWRRVGLGPQQARELLDREVRRANRERLAVVPRRGQRRARPDGQFVTGNDPNDANVPSNSTFQQGWVQHLVSRWGTNASRRAALLHSRQRTEPLALHPSRRPAHWRDDGRDQEPDGRLRDEDQSGRSDRRWWSGPKSGAGADTSTAATTSNTAARTAGASCPIATITAVRTTCPGCSDSSNRASTTAGQRLLDVFTIHYYPQGGEFSDDVSIAMQLRRNRSTRSLWDPAYVDETWINDRVQLIPRLKNWVSTSYPGTLSASPSTTGVQKTTSTARRHRRTSLGSSAARAWTWVRAGRRPPPARRPTRR